MNTAGNHGGSWRRRSGLLLCIHYSCSIRSMKIPDDGDGHLASFQQKYVSVCLVSVWFVLFLLGLL